MSDALHFFSIENIKIKFHESCPRDMIVEKSRDHGKSWMTLQYFSDDCDRKFNLKGYDRDDEGLTIYCVFKTLWCEKLNRIVFHSKTIIFKTSNNK